MSLAAHSAQVEPANGELLARQVKLVAPNATSVVILVIPGSGHWLLGEKPKETTEVLKNFP